MVQLQSADICQKLRRRDPLVQGLKLDTIHFTKDLISETLLPLRENSICEALGELHIERDELAPIKSVHFLRCGLVLDNGLIHPEIVVNLPPDKFKLSCRDRRLLLLDGGIFVFAVRDNHAGAVGLHAEIIPDKGVPPSREVLLFGDGRGLQNTPDHGNEAGELAHALIKGVRRLQDGEEGAVVVPENIVVQVVTPEMYEVLIWDGVDVPRRKGEAGIHTAHILHEVHPGGVDRIDGGQLAAVEHGEDKGVIIHNELSGHAVIKGVGGHIRIRPDPENPLHAVGNGFPPPPGTADVPGLYLCRIPGPCVHGGADGSNVPRPPIKWRKAGVIGREEPKHREVAPARWPFTEYGLKKSANIQKSHCFTPRHT